MVELFKNSYTSITVAKYPDYSEKCLSKSAYLKAMIHPCFSIQPDNLNNSRSKNYRSILP